MSSSMRNAVQRRNHKERAQPQGREKKFGFLEKKKDYTLRAKDYNEKKRRLKILRQKAAERNPDEFHFAMTSSRVDRSGRKVAERSTEAMSHEAVQLLKTQDAGYLRTMAAKARKDIARLEQSMVLEDDGEVGGETSILLPGMRAAANKTVFVDDLEGQDAAVLGRTVLPTDVSDDEVEETDKAKSKLRRLRSRQQAWRQDKLEALKKREQDLAAAEAALDMERARMANNVGGVNKNGIKFKRRERKR